MSQRMGQQASKQVEDQASPWTFSVDLTTTTAFDPNNYRVITGGATINLILTGATYTGTMKFNVPVMEPPGSSPGQIAWSKTAYQADVDYTSGVLTVSVPTAGPKFGDNFNADDGTPITPPPAGPAIDPAYCFIFKGTWDGSSETITNGQAWVPGGWLEDAGGTLYGGQPPSAQNASPTADAGGEGGGDDPPPNATWGSG